MLRARGLPAGTDEEVSQSLRTVAHDRSQYADVWAVSEALLQHDELAANWRARHVTMVERMIGVQVRHRRVERLDLPPEPAAAALLPAAVGAALRALTQAGRHPSGSLGVSTTTHDVAKSELIDKAIDLAQAGKGPAGRPTTRSPSLLRAYYRHVAAEDVADRSDVDVYGAFASHYKLAGERPQGTARVRVVDPDAGRARLVGRRATAWSRSSSTTCRSSSTR